MSLGKGAPVKLVIDVPVRTRTPGNTRRAWQMDWREAKRQRETAASAAKLALAKLSEAEKLAFFAAPAVVVQVTRFGSRRLDPQNVFGAVKHVIDGVADALGVDDGNEWYDWRLPKQEKGSPMVRVELSTGDDTP